MLETHCLLNNKRHRYIFKVVNAEAGTEEVCAKMVRC